VNVGMMKSIQITIFWSYNMNKQNLIIEKEKELLAIMINEPGTSLEIFSKVTPDMISEKYKGIFESISQLKPLDSAGIIWEFKKRNDNSLTEILDLSTRLIPNLNLRLREFFDVRDSIKADSFLIESLKESKNTLLGLDTLNSLKEKIESELSKYSRFDIPKSFDESIEGIIERIEKKIRKNDSLKTVLFPSFNTATGGLNEGNLITIAGAFKNGKTTFGLNLMLDIAAQGIPSVIFSLEMSLAEIQDKILGYKTGISYEKLRNPQRLNENERLSVARFKSKNHNEKLFIFDKSSNMNEIENNIKMLKKRAKLKAVMIDYIGLIKSVSKQKSIESREREISLLSNSLKVLAKESGTIIIVLAQLNRSGIKEASSINLAESIALARESDFLFTIYKPESNGYSRVKMNGKEIQITDSDFIVKLDSSRHTPNGKEFLLRLDENGKMKELETNCDNSYLNASREYIEL
jgi:replicative DNA helicase